MVSVEVLSGPERRRRWSIEQKQAIVAAAFEPGAGVRDVARHADVTPSLVYRWRRGLRAAANGFAQVLVPPAGDGISKFDPYRRVIARMVAAAYVSVNAGSNQAAGYRRAQQQMVDTQPGVAGKGVPEMFPDGVD